MTSPNTDPALDRLTTDRQFLRDHFSSVPPEQQGVKWAELWEQDFLPWDKGSANPALVDLLAEWEKHDFFVAHEALKTRRRALVPGCGRGYDTHLLATYGYDAYGLDISEKAIKEASNWALEQMEREKDSRPEHELSRWGQVHMVEGDFFKDEWCETRNIPSKGGFDFIYDYTFLCALPLELRQSWADTMTKLLAPQHGLLVCLEFPLYKPLESGGPPWGLTSKVYEELLGDTFNKVLHYKPKRTHKIGEGSDWISVWRRKSE